MTSALFLKLMKLLFSFVKVTAGGKAAKAGVVQGYIIEKVNGEEFSNLSHHAAQNKIKNAGFSLSLTLR